MVTKKFATLWRIARAKQAYVVYQQYPGQTAHSIGFGKAELKDLVLMSKELKISYDGFLDMINHSAIEQGQLHALKEIREAVDVIEGQDDGRN